MRDFQTLFSWPAIADFLGLLSPEQIWNHLQTLFSFESQFYRLNSFLHLHRLLTSLLLIIFIFWFLRAFSFYRKEHRRRHLAVWTGTIAAVLAASFLVLRAFFIPVSIDTGILVLIGSIALTTYAVVSITGVLFHFLYSSQGRYPASLNKAADLFNVPALPLTIVTCCVIAFVTQTLHPLFYLFALSVAGYLSAAWWTTGTYYLPLNSLPKLSGTFSVPSFVRTFAQECRKFFAYFIEPLTSGFAPSQSQEKRPETTDVDTSPDSPLGAMVDPLEGIHLKIRRSLRTTAFGSLRFMLDARMAVSSENHELIRKFKLGPQVVYDSANREKYSQQARDFADSTHEQPSLLHPNPAALAWGAAKTMFSLGRAGLAFGFAALSLRVTVESLLSGVHIESKDLNELLATENAIFDAAKNVKGYLVVAATYDGSEVIFEL